MATNELNALIRVKDAAGNTNLIYPITKKENVEGLDEAITSAKAYTDAEIAEWVGDTTVSEQVSTAKSSAISTAASDATTKANSALSSAKTYTDNTIADEVEARDSAIATAKSSAISTASSDATTKANSALASAKSYSDSGISTHNSSSTAHSDIRELITDLTDRLNALADSDDETLDQLSEVVSYIKSNRSLIEEVTTNKVNVADIVNNLTTASASKVLSANQGVVIKGLIDALQSSLNNHTANTTVHITSTERTNWNAAKTHADSAHAPSNAEKNQNAFSNIAVGSTTIAADSATDTLTLAGSNVTITPDATNDKVTIGITKANVTSALGYTPPTTNTTYSAMTGATTDAAGKAGLVPAPSSGAATRYLRSDGTWATPPNTNTTYSAMTGATSSAAGKAGLVPAPAAGKQASFLRGDGTWATPTDTNTTYSAGTGISLSGTTFSNSGVRSVATGTSNGTISVNTNGTTANVSVKGLGSAAYTASSAYDAAGTAQTKANAALSSAKSYTDTKVAALVDSAPETMNTLNELATAIAEHQDVTDALNAAIGTKANINHTHDDRYYTESEIDSKVSALNSAISGKAASSHTHSAYVNQNAFSNVKVGSTTIAADSTTDTLTIAAGSNVTITPDATNDKITIAAKDTVYTHPNSGVTAGTYKSVTVNAQGHVTGGSNPTTLSGYGITDAAAKSHTHTWGEITSKPSYYDAKAIKTITRSGTTFTYTCLDGTTGTFTQQDSNTTYGNASPSSAGLMSASDKSKLDGIASGANAYSLPTASSSTLGGVKTGSNITNSSGTISLTKANVTSALGYTPPTTNTTYSAATTSSAGLMSASDKSKLDGIASGATKITVDSVMSSSSTNPVQNKVVQTALEKKPGRNVQGETILDMDEEEYIGGTCAEIFNDCECNIASGNYSHAEGTLTYAFGYCSHAEGESTSASGNYSHAEGYSTNASGECSHAEGESANASGYCSHAEGESTNASGNYSHAEGYNTIANNFQHASGKYNVSTTAPSSHNTQNTTQTDGIFIVGCGTSSARKNAFRISSGGKCFGTESFGASGADFAELFEWADGNPDSEDRRGLFVTLDGEKIKLANAGDDYIGIISSAQAFVGNSASEDWQGKYLTDVFGTKLSQEVEIPAEIDEETGEVLTPATTTTQYVLNPDYDPEQEYVMRENRKEWGIVGLLGQIVVIDDGTCVVGGRIEPSANGIGTSSTSGYRVMARIDENHVKVLVK